MFYVLPAEVNGYDHNGDDKRKPGSPGQMEECKDEAYNKIDGLHSVASHVSQGASSDGQSELLTKTAMFEGTMHAPR